MSYEKGNLTKRSARIRRYKSFISDKKWVAKININKKVTHIGFFTDEIEAAKAYDNMAGEVYGEFARLNFPNQKYGVDLSV